MRALPIVAVSLSLLSTPCVARDFDFQQPADQREAIGAFTNLAAFCSQLGFRTQPSLPIDAMQRKLEAYMLLASDREAVLERWVSMLRDWNQLSDAPRDKALLDRAADALIAAAKDPDSYGQAEELYIQTAMGPAKLALSSCERAATDDFVGKYFITGTGSIENWESKLKQAFAESVQQIKADLAKQKK